MRDLLARLAKQDEEASAALRVLDYFDELDRSTPGPEAYLRGAAALSSSSMGMILRERKLVVRVGPRGDRLPAEKSYAPDQDWISRPVNTGSDDIIWMERSEEGAFPALILERVAAGVERWLARVEALTPEPAQAWAMLLNDPLPEDRRRQLLADLRLDPSGRYQVVAGVRSESGPGEPIAAYASVRGVQVRAEIRPAPFEMDYAAGSRARFGIGPAVTNEDLLDSWHRAVVVLRIARPGEALPWDRLWVLGPLFLHAKTSDLLEEPVVAAIESGNLPWLDQTVTAITQTGSVRGAADLLGLHHSTVQKRVDRLQQQFDMNVGNARHLYHLWLACAAHRFATFGTPANMESEVRLTPRPFDPPAL